jgi:hypothetical protein
MSNIRTTIYILGLILIGTLVCNSCQKSLFRHIEVHGRILDSKTYNPLQATINLWSGSAPGSKGGSKFESTISNADGTFDLKSRASWTTNDYYLEIIRNTNSNNPSTLVKFRVSKNQDLNLGDIFI